MKTVAQLSQSAYEAYCKMHRDVGPMPRAVPLLWSQLSRGAQQCWVAAVTQLWAEFSAIQIGVQL